MIYDTVQANQLTARRLKNQAAIDIYSVILGECQSKDDFSDQFLLTFVGRVIQSNTECLQKRDSDTLRRQNALLKDLVPRLTRNDVKRIAETLDMPNHKGKATGVLVKALKAEGFVPDMDLVNAYLDRNDG